MKMFDRLRGGADTRCTAFFALIAICVASTAAPARADNSAHLMHRVQGALAQNDNLNGAHCYAASAGVSVLYGTVFDKKDP